MTPPSQSEVTTKKPLRCPQVLCKYSPNLSSIILVGIYLSPNIYVNHWLGLYFWYFIGVAFAESWTKLCSTCLAVQKLNRFLIRVVQEFDRSIYWIAVYSSTVGVDLFTECRALGSILASVSLRPLPVQELTSKFLFSFPAALEAALTFLVSTYD